MYLQYSFYCGCGTPCSHSETSLISLRWRLKCYHTHYVLSLPIEYTTKYRSTDKTFTYSMYKYKQKLYIRKFSKSLLTPSSCVLQTYKAGPVFRISSRDCTFVFRVHLPVAHSRCYETSPCLSSGSQVIEASSVIVNP